MFFIFKSKNIEEDVLKASSDELYAAIANGVDACAELLSSRPKCYLAEVSAILRAIQVISYELEKRTDLCE